MLWYLPSQITIIQLPVEILTKIAGFLNQKDLISLAATCTKLKEVCAFRKFWVHLDLTQFDDIPNELLTLVMQKTHQVLYVNMGCNNTCLGKELDLYAVFSHLWQVQEFLAPSCKIIYSSYFLSSMLNFAMLDISGCENVTNNIVYHLQTCQKIHSLNISNNR